MWIRPARADDLVALVELAVAFYAEDNFDTPAAALGANLEVLIGSGAAHVAVGESEDGVLIGFAVTTTSFGLENGPIAELEDLYVVPHRRRDGVGRALITDSVGWARKRGCEHLELVIAPDGTDVSYLFAYYSHLGFTDQGRRLLTRPLRSDPDVQSGEGV